MKIEADLSNLDTVLRASVRESDLPKAKTLFLKALAAKAHRFYGGKMQTIPKAPVLGFNWFNVWYTPGVSRISTTIRDDNESSYDLSNRSNLVAGVSDATRLLGAGDCTPPGGRGVMEGKAFLMKYLGGIDAVALCVDSHDSNGKHCPKRIIDFVKMAEPSFGAVNLEDISQPNCYEVLDTLREECDIPVWHDDAQGTACVTIAGLINALKIAEKRIEDVNVVLFGAGAANTAIARFIIACGGDPARMTVFDSRGGLHRGRKDIEADKAYYRKWEICMATNPRKVSSFDDAIRGADALIALSAPGPGVFKKEQIASMAKRSIVFACSNPVPEIYPQEAHEAGAFIVATGRGDFPNQVNNSIGFPGILKGALLARARKISDGMAIAAARSLASFAEKRGISPTNIVATMEETEVFVEEAAAVAEAAVAEGLARVSISGTEAAARTREDIARARKASAALRENGLIADPPQELIDEAFEEALKGSAKK